MLLNDTESFLLHVTFAKFLRHVAVCCAFAPSLYDGDNCDDKAVEGVFESILVKPALREYELARFALHEHPDLPALAEVLVEGLDARQG